MQQKLPLLGSIDELLSMRNSYIRLILPALLMRN